MPSFEETLARMKGLYTYGKEINESSKINAHTLEHQAVAADGVTYGIIKENSKYYIKSAPKGKETIAEAYEYLGGFCNKGRYEYNSYANALKQFELKLASINEACDQKINVETLNPFRANTVLAEATDSMRDEIARQRQIMYNAAMLMNESIEMGVSRKDDTVMYDGKNPEAETGKKGDEGYEKTSAKPDYAGSKKGFNPKATPFDGGAGNPKDQLKEGEDIGDAPLMPNTENWGTEGINKGRGTKSIGWDIDGQQKVNEEEEDWASKGLPSTPGVGEADTDHNNNPFNKGLNEEEDDEMGSDVEGGEDLGGEVPSDDSAPAPAADEEPADDMGGEEDMSNDTDLDAGVEDVDLGTEDGEGEELGDEDDALADDSMSDEEPSDDEDLLSQIEDLQSQIDALRAKLEGEDEPMDDEPMGDEPMDGDMGDDMGDEPMDDSAMDSSFDSEFDSEGEGDEFGAEEGDEFGSEDSSDFSSEEGGEDYLGDDNDLDECGGFPEELAESKRRVMNNIVESVVKKILAEDELHVFGKHPGYRKKPMELPSTGEDKNQWGEDWNDESVHSEEPFGQKVGDGNPFNKLVDMVTKDVMYKIGASIENADKKKE